MEEVLTSASNSTIKRLRKLISSSKARSDENTYVAEGIHLVKSFLTAGQVPQLYACAASALKNPEVAEIVDRLDSENVKRIVIADSLFESLSSIHSSVGILLLFSFSARPDDSMTPLTSDAVLLEDIQDPGNIGTILRTAAATGVKRVIVSSRCASPWSPKALRAGMGAQFSLAVQENADLTAVIAAAKVPVLATTLTRDSQSLFKTDLRQPVAWLLGNEGQGVSTSLVKQATTKVHIPQEDTSVESLNVAAAAAVCLYEQYRQRIG